jgi:hypothetical protein
MEKALSEFDASNKFVLCTESVAYLAQGLVGIVTIQVVYISLY